MFRFFDQGWKGMQMGEIVKLLTSTSGHSLVKSFSGPDVIQQPFSTGKLFNVSEEPVSDLQSLSALLHRLEGDPTHMEISFWTRPISRCSSAIILHCFGRPRISYSIGPRPNKRNFYRFNSRPILWRKGWSMAVGRGDYRIWRSNLDHATRI